MWRTCFCLPKVTEICCCLRDLVCSRARSHLPFMRGSKTQLFSFTTHFTLVFILCSNSDCQFYMFGFWGLRQLVWHGGEKGIGVEYLHCAGAIDQLLKGPWMLLKTVLHIVTSGATDLRGTKTSNIPFQPEEEAINNIPCMGTLIWDYKKTY